MKMKTALVTGGNRGIGLALVKRLVDEGFKVYLGCRSLEKGRKAIEEIGSNKNVIALEIDIESEESIKNAYETYMKIKDPDEKLDCLFNNAAVNLDWIPNIEYKKVFEVDRETYLKAYNINTLGAVFVSKYFSENMKDGGSIVNVGTGALELCNEMAYQDNYPAYAASKIALLMLTKKMAAALKERKISVNIACPGWCKSDMGGDLASDGPEVGADSFFKAAFVDFEGGEPAAEKPTGKFFRYGNLIPIDNNYYYQPASPEVKPEKKKVKFIQQIFSIINENNHKVVRLLGIKLKIRKA